MMEKRLERINKVIDYYRELALNHAPVNSFTTKKTASFDTIFGRLKRAALDEECDDLLPSRYAIWVSDVIDLIDGAMSVIKRNNTDEIMKQMLLVSNVLKAYKDIQVVLDDERIFKVNGIFKSYAVNLVNRDDRGSETIESSGIIKLLKERTNNSQVGLPSGLDFSIKNGVLRVYIHSPEQNMQTNAAAFESWILALKAWLSAEIEYVMLDFDIPDIKERYGKPEACHYNRFLYRLNNMLRLYPDWFFLNDSKTHVVANFMDCIKASNCLLNHSLKERESVIDTDKMERQIESWFAFESGKKPLCELLDINEDKLFNQLPVGVFYEEITSGKSLFTRGAGAIDLWGIGKDDQTLHIIELKCGGNINMGVISESLFYSAIIYDTCIAKDSLFTFGRYKDAQDTKDMIAIKNGGNKFGTLFVHILAERFHPLFDEKVMSLISDGLSTLNIRFDRAKYDYSKKAFIG